MSGLGHVAMEKSPLWETIKMNLLLVITNLMIYNWGQSIGFIRIVGIIYLIGLMFHVVHIPAMRIHWIHAGRWI